MRCASILLATVLLGTLSNPVLAADGKVATNWHQWRGPNFDGTSDSADPPAHWSDSSNIKWKVKIPGLGSASPVVWEDKVFIATAIETDRPAPAGSAPGQGSRLALPAPNKFVEYVLMCLDRNTGKEIWKSVATQQVPHEGRHNTNSFASGSPTTDGQLVYISFGSRGIFCFDMQGKKVWERDLGDMTTRNGFGEGASPTLHGDSLIVQWDHEGPSFIEVLDARTGQTRWKRDREEVTTWATPLVVEFEGRTQIITNATKRSRSYDLKTGEVIWECGGQFTNPIPCPLLVDKNVICMTGYQGYAIYSIPLASKGDLTDTDRITWKRNDAAPYVSSAVLYGGQLYFTKSRDSILSIVDARTGDAFVEQIRLPGTSSFYASPVAAKDRIYFTGRDGTTVVLKHSKKMEIIATNRLGEGVDASPALVGKQIFIRGAEHLYCIE